MCEFVVSKTVHVLLPVYANPSVVVYGLISISLKEERTPDGLARVSQWPLLSRIYSMVEYVVLPFVTEDAKECSF